MEDIMTGLWRRCAASWRRWCEDSATSAALDRLDPMSAAEFAALIRLRRDESELGGKGRSVRPASAAHVAGRGLKAHP
jgi:hypothetical protein